MQLNLRKITQSSLLIAAFVAFLVILSLAQKYSHYPQNLEDIPLIEGKSVTAKQAPANKGGKQFQNQDKHVFKILDSGE